MAPCGEIHVSDGTTGDQEACDHFGEVVGGDSVAVSGVEDGALLFGQFDALGVV